MSRVKVVFDMLGGVSSIKCTEWGPFNSLKSNDCPSTRRCEQSKVTADTRAGSRSKAEGRLKLDRCNRMSA